VNQAEINAAMLPWGDAEFRRFAYRVGLFGRRGLADEAAEQVADRLALRDQQQDDRRMCIECVNIQRPGTCHAAAAGLIPGMRRDGQVLKTVLQRCHQFKFQTP
jgi:hypothetical protein